MKKPNIYASGGIDRAAKLREDEGWVAERPGKIGHFEDLRGIDRLPPGLSQDPDPGVVRCFRV